jgi:hypothetical protein
LERIRLTSGIAARPRAAKKEILPPPSVFCPAAQKEELNEIYSGDHQIFQIISENPCFFFFDFSFSLCYIKTKRSWEFVFRIYIWVQLPRESTFSRYAVR